MTESKMINFKFNIKEVGKDIYCFMAERTCTISVCIKDRSALVIDSGGSPATARTAIETIKEKFNANIELLINTHYHSDHTFGNQAFKCPIWATRKCLDLMRFGLDSYWKSEEIRLAMEEDKFLNEVWQDLKIVLPTDTFENEKTFDFNGTLIHCENYGGHSEDSAIVFFPGEGVLISGDTVFGRRYPTMLEQDGQPYRLIDSLNKIKTIDFKTIIPGHGEPDDKSLLDFSLAYWNCIIGEAENVITAGMQVPMAVESLLPRCRLKGIEYDEFRHKRNITTVVKYIHNNRDKIPS